MFTSMLVVFNVHSGAAPQLHNPLEDSHAQREPGESWIPVSDDINEEDNAREGNAESINWAIMHEHQMMYYAGMEGGAGAATSWEDMHAKAAGEEEVVVSSKKKKTLRRWKKWKKRLKDRILKKLKDIRNSIKKKLKRQKIA
ncbi:hypothetical protein GOP47_0016039 [Adiantum capillus-veneris]|uniref:Uncharacterized protein n=1 Tax=Adiantum capillus-veneris TaxID=13818 RepID=A0A9D4ULY4_ADICA|nr:hypothetical protein GOP47_0016039 [Adiantum capillus-veneris]